MSAWVDSAAPGILNLPLTGDPPPTCSRAETLAFRHERDGWRRRSPLTYRTPKILLPILRRRSLTRGYYLAIRTGAESPQKPSSRVWGRIHGPGGLSIGNPARKLRGETECTLPRHAIIVPRGRRVCTPSRPFSGRPQGFTGRSSPRASVCVEGTGGRSFPITLHSDPYPYGRRVRLGAVERVTSAGPASAF
jgi:hypothetical protein